MDKTGRKHEGQSGRNGEKARGLECVKRGESMSAGVDETPGKSITARVNEMLGEIMARIDEMRRKHECGIR